MVFTTTQRGVKMFDYRWVVWVGIEEHYFMYREDAQDFADIYLEQGYPDIFIEDARNGQNQIH